MILTCSQCGKEFEFSESEIKFYKSKGFTYPKRCKDCRNSVTPKNLDIKASSFFENFQNGVVLAGVEGGLSVEHVYIVKCLLENNEKYILLNEGVLHLIDERKEATHFKCHDAKKVVEMLEIQKKVENIKAIPLSYYSTIHPY